MVNNVNIKKILRNIYKIDYSKIILKCDDEFILQSNGVSEFTQYLKKVDMDNGIIVTLANYRSGIFYSTDNDGELYCPSKLLPDVATFSMNILGLKKGYFYRIIIPARDTDSNTIITTDRTITVADDSNQAILSANLSGYGENQECVGYFRANSNEANLFFTFGKIILKDIIIDEVVLAEEENLGTSEDELNEEVPEGKLVLSAYSTFDMQPTIPEGYKGRYVTLLKTYGKGLAMCYDTTTKEYVIERDNADNVLPDSFITSNYIVDINTNKLAAKDIFTTYVVTEVSPDISPIMLKQGYIKFALYNAKGEKVPYTSNGRVSIIIRKIV